MPLHYRSLFNAALRVSPILGFLLVSGGYAPAAVVAFTAEDLNAGPGAAHPASSAAAANFDAAAALLGTVSTVNFESSPVGTFSSLTVAPGVTITGTATGGGNQSIANTPGFPVAPALDGFNTTAGGANYLEIHGGTVTFTFANPTQFFGAYIMGIQTVFYTDVITFSDGSSQTLNILGAGTTSGIGALDFIGFTDAGKSITSITLTAGDNNSADYIGLDDLRFQSVAAISSAPEPNAAALVVLGGMGLALGYLRRRRTA